MAGLDDLCLALLLTAVSPAAGGVLVRGEKSPKWRKVKHPMDAGRKGLQGIEW